MDGGDADAIYKEMTASVIGNAHFVAAGIIAVNRAQERGYSSRTAGSHEVSVRLPRGRTEGPHYR